MTKEELEILDAPSDLASSIIWDYSSSFYKTEGLKAWEQGKVPYSITHNHLIVEKYVRIIKGILEKSNSQSVTVLELGGGAGRFAWQILKELELQFKRKLTNTDLKYILTDAVESNLTYAYKHPKLKDFFNSGVLETCIYEFSNEITKIEIPTDIIVIIANYAFDSFPQDIFYIENNAAQILKPTIFNKAGFNFKEDNIDKLHIVYDKKDISNTYYKNERIDRVLRKITEKNEKGFLIFPISALRFLDFYCDKKLILLASDLPMTDIDSPFCNNLPRLNWRGGIWLPVDFSVFHEWFKCNEGIMLSSLSYEQNLTTVFGLFKECEELCRDNLNANLLDNNTPDNRMAIYAILNTHKETLTISEIIAWFNFCVKDPELLRPGLEIIRLRYKEIGKREIDEIKRIAKTTEQYYFPVQSAWDLFSAFAELFFHLSLHEVAEYYWKESIKNFGENQKSLFGSALNYVHLNQYTIAKSLLEKILKVNSNEEAALTLNAWIVDNAIC